MTEQEKYFLGVCTYLKDKLKWRAGVQRNGKFHSLGSFATPEEANERAQGFLSTEKNGEQIT